MRLFIYGTLQDSALLAAVAGPGAVEIEAARLADHQVMRLSGYTVPMIEAKPGALASGQLISGLNDAQWARLDLYEAAFGYQLRAATVLLADGSECLAQLYFPAPEARASADVWSFAEWQTNHASVAAAMALEIFSHDPTLSGAEIRQGWDQIQARAEARQRGQQGSGPAALRFAPGADDLAPAALTVPMGKFFRFGTASLRHRKFDGKMSSLLEREIFVGFDAALVLPYDPVLDQVCLIEQFRSGPALRRDANPWMLEPVAGMVDAGEAPAQAARREAREEAGLELQELRKMFQVYASPGGSTDFFYCYLGFADLSSSEKFGLFGLKEEGEDIRAHVLSFEQALKLLDSGEIRVAPLVAMLLWLARERPAILASA